MSSPSKRQRIVLALMTRLQAIRTVDGFETGAGSAVFYGETPSLGPDDPEVAIVVVPQEDESSYQGVKMFLKLPIQIQAIAKADVNTPYLAAEAVLTDIKRAVELTDRTLGGLVARQIERGPTVVLPREPGSETVGLGITYRAPYEEVWGAP